MTTVSLTKRTADALSNLGIGDVHPVEGCERMAWIVMILKRLKDSPLVFPRGKWATIQEIERQLEHAAVKRADECRTYAGLTEDGA